MKEPDGARGPVFETTVTYLEMTDRPELRRADLPQGFAIDREPRIDLGLYRELYRLVGDPWLWFERKKLDDDELRAVVHDPRVELLVLREGGAGVGLAELDLRSPPDVELVYFGVAPRLIGRGVGRAFFDAVLEAAWAPGIERFWLHTCTLDHPRALPFYLDAGFEPYRTERQTVVDPRTQPFWNR